MTHYGSLLDCRIGGLPAQRSLPCADQLPCLPAEDVGAVQRGLHALRSRQLLQADTAVPNALQQNCCASKSRLAVSSKWQQPYTSQVWTAAQHPQA